MHSSGKTIELAAGNYQAKIVTVGAGIAELTHNGRHIVLPHKPEEMPLAHMGKVLIPWPNRVENGCYQHDGIEFNLAINDRVSNAAIHGLLAWRDWQIACKSASNVTLTVFLPPSYGYPFALMSQVTYQLDAESGLLATIETQNIGDKPAPYGAGTHPYLTCNLEKVDHCELTLPVDEHGLNFLTPKLIGATQIDHTFATTPETDWEVCLTSQRQEMSVFLRSNQPWLQIYTGDKLQRAGLAVEPMSCPPNAFNSKVDLVSLAPEETHRMHFVMGCK